MLRREEIIYEYEQILLEKKKKYISSFIGSDQQKKEAAGIILNYAIVHIMRWDSETAKANITSEGLKSLCLDTVLKTMNIPTTKLDQFSIRKILQLAFPNDKRYTLTRQTIDIYTQVLNIDGDSSIKEFPKGFFTDADGLKRAGICLMYAISMSLYDKTLRELYDFFASPESSKWLKEMKLLTNSKKLYDTPLEFFHYSLPLKQRNYIFYYNDYIECLCSKEKKSA